MATGGYVGLCVLAQRHGWKVLLCGSRDNLKPTKDDPPAELTVLKLSRSGETEASVRLAAHAGDLDAAADEVVSILGRRGLIPS